MHHSSPLQSPRLLCEGRENTDNVDNLYVVRHSAENANLNTVNEELNMQQRPSKVHKNLNNRYWKCFEYPLTPGQVMMGKGRLYWFCESKQWPSPRLHCTLHRRGAGVQSSWCFYFSCFIIYAVLKNEIYHTVNRLRSFLSSCHHAIMSLILHFQRFHELNNWLTNNIRTFRSALRTWTISISHEINYEGRHFLKYLVILIIKSYFFCISCL